MTSPTTGEPKYPETRWAIVTGTSSGMGEAIAKRLISHGWHVLGIDLVGSTHSPMECFKTAVAGITDREALASVIDRELPEDVPLRLVVNVAGIYPPSTLESFDEALYRRVFDVNVLGTLNVIAESRSYLADEAVIVNFASVDAFTVSPGQLLYGASKAAVVMLTKALALELARYGTRVNAIAPGWVDTPGNMATGRMEHAAQTVPLGRVAQPEEIAEWVTLLAENSGFLTGETIVLSGGDVLR